MDSTSELVDLNGRTIPLEALRLGWALEDRGLRLSVQELPDGPVLRVSEPGGGKPALSDTEVTAIRRWKFHLMAFLVEPTPPPAHSERSRRSRSKAPAHS